MTGSASIDALVLAAGRGERLGLGRKAWLVLGGHTLLERAVAVMRSVADRVLVGVADEDVDRARDLWADGVVVLAGRDTRQATMRAVFEATRAGMVVLHDVAHPFVTPALARDVIDVAYARRAAVAAVVSTSAALGDSRGAERIHFGPGEVQLVRRPVAFHRDDFVRGLQASGDRDSVEAILGRAGVQISLVASPPWNIKITTRDDWALAGSIEAGLRPTSS